MVEVEFNLMLAELAGRRSMKLELEGPVALKQFIGRVGLTDDDVGMLLINKQWAPLDCVIHDGDFVQLYPDLEGG